MFNLGMWIKRTVNSIRGFITWLKVGYPFLLLCAVLLAVAIWRSDNWLHIWVLVTLSCVFVVVEMLNYAIEKVCDLISQEYNKEIKAIKDIVAGAVLVSVLVLGTVSLWVII